MRTQAFRRLPKFKGFQRVRKLSAGRGRQRAIPHQKCFVLLDDGDRPFACVYGSWNSSGSAGTNLELMSREGWKVYVGNLTLEPSSYIDLVRRHSR